MRIMLLGLACAMLAACSGGGADTVSFADGKGGTTTIKSDGTKATITGEDGATATMNSGAQNANFPDFAPQYPGSTIESASSMSAKGKTSHFINLTTADAPQKVRDFYKASLAKSGAKINESSAGDTFIVGTGDAVPGGSATIAPNDQGNGTTIALILSTKD